MPVECFRCYLVSWDEVYKLTETLVFKIKHSGFKPDIVIGIARGGLVPARIVCDFLLQKNLVCIKAEHWGIASMLGEAKITYPLPVDISGKKVLVVDDVVDSGDTCAVVMKHIAEKNPSEVRTAVLHYKTSSTFVPDYWAEKQAEWKWIIYPWALYEDITGFIERVLAHPMTHENIRKALKGFDIEISRKELIKILNQMHLEERVKRWKKGNRVLWEGVK